MIKAFFIWNYLCSMVCKCGVPIFLMISGSLPLDREESNLDTYKRIPRIFIDLVVFSVLYYWVDSVRGNESSFLLFLTLEKIIQVNYWHLWYLYAYIIFIITLPLMRKLVKGLDVSSVKYMVAIEKIISGVISIIEVFGDISVYQYLKPSWISKVIFI